jgi:hypothetical protein
MRVNGAVLRFPAGAPSVAPLCSPTFPRTMRRPLTERRRALGWLRAEWR